jgi:L-alanine-DL-glutamate epimerase-like enolase superfamily enzyme
MTDGWALVLVHGWKLYVHVGSPQAIQTAKLRNFTAFKTGIGGSRPSRIVETKGFVDGVAERFARLREAAGPEGDIAVDFLGPISLAAGLQLAAAIPNFLCQEQASLGDGYLKQPFQVQGGHIPLPTGPGLGIELDEEALAAKIDHDWRNPERYDPEDGSVMDW